MIDDIAFILGTTFMYSTPLIFGALAGVISERAGVVNIGIEGSMVLGCFAAAAAAYIFGNPWMGILVALLAGVFIGTLHAIATVTFKGNHVVAGIAINFIGPAMALFISKLIFDGATNTPTVSKTIPYPLAALFTAESGAMSKNGFFELIFNQSSMTYIALIMVAIMWLWMYKTRSGLRVRAIGEHPKAADTLGVKVNLTKFICVIISGMFGALGGAAMSIGIVSNFRPGLISGHGFIALAAVIFGKWTPHGSLLACLLFGASNGLVIYLGKTGLNIDSALLSMLPYVITLIILVAFVGRSKGPAASGKPYEKG